MSLHWAKAFTGAALRSAVNRRNVIRTIGVVSAALAGCSLPGSPRGGTDTPGTTTGTDTAGVGGTTFEVVNNGCGTGTDEATVGVSDTTIDVSGTISGANTCYTAEVDGVTHRDGTVTIAVRAFVPESRRDSACGQCLVDVEYRASVAITGGHPDRVVVTHDGEQVTTRTV